MARKDKWKAKEWYEIVAPEMFGKQKIGETLADEQSKLIGRRVETTFQELTGDLSKTHVTLNFQIYEVKGKKAYTRFVGHELGADYVRRLVRKRRSRIDGVCDVRTKDGTALRVKPLAISGSIIQSSVATAVRKKMGGVVEHAAKSKPLIPFSMDMITGKLAARVFKHCKTIYPLRRVEIRKSEIAY